MSVPLAPWLRRMVIRGDVATVGVAAGLAGLLVGVGVGSRSLPPVYAAVATALVVVGAALVAWARSRWTALLAEVRASRATWVPPEPPVFVEPGLWRARNTYDPDLDAESELQAEVDRDWGSFEADMRRAFVDPRLRLVSEDERELAGGVSPAPAVCPADLVEILIAAEGRHLLSFPRWPVCCGALSTLTALDAGADDGLELPEAGEAALPKLAPVRIGEVVDEPPRAPVTPVAPRLSAYTCRVCGGRYRSAWG
jgi:hypothetical protein